MLDPSEIFNARILIVDDRQDDIRLLERMLGKAGYSRVAATTEPREVCERHRQNRYDLILLDLLMPDMDGFEVLDGLRAVESDGYVPVLAITAEPSHKLRALKAGAKDFVSKPLDLVEVETRIHNLLEVRLLYQSLASHNARLEQTVLERTAELRESEERFRRLTELSTDWYWEQDDQGRFTRVSGPALEMLCLREDGSPDPDARSQCWNAAERAVLDENIDARQPFLDFVYSRVNADGSRQYFQVSGEPIFGASGHYLGYRGVGMDVTGRMLTAA